jgi:hypothetical protein
MVDMQAYLIFGQDEVVVENDWAAIFGYLTKVKNFPVSFFSIKFLASFTPKF